MTSSVIRPIGAPFSMDRLTPALAPHSSLRKCALERQPRRVSARASGPIAPTRASTRTAGLRPGIPASSRQTSIMPRVVRFHRCAFHSSRPLKPRYPSPFTLLPRLERLPRLDRHQHESSKRWATQRCKTVEPTRASLGKRGHPVSPIDHDAVEAISTSLMPVQKVAC